MDEALIKRLEDRMVFVKDEWPDWQLGPKPDADFIARNRERFPEYMFYVWEHFGFAEIHPGGLWLTNPEEFEPIVANILEGTGLEEIDDFITIRRDPFGDLSLYGIRTSSTLSVDMTFLRIFPTIEREEQTERFKTLRFTGRLFSAYKPFNEKLFAQCQKKLGTLSVDEVYGFAPHPALGGNKILKYAMKTDLLPYLNMVSQLDQFGVMRDIYHSIHGDDE